MNTESQDQGCGCDEYQSLSRRHFFKNFVARGAPVAAALGLPRIALAGDEKSDRDVFVHIFLRGGMDGLTTVVPYGDVNLYNARPNLAIQPPGNPNGAVDLDGFFGLAPSAAPLLTPYQAGDLAFVHASGSPDPTHSHFDAFSFMEFGIPNQSLSTVSDGWLARHLGIVPPMSTGPLRGVSLSNLMPKTLLRAPATLPIADLSDFSLGGPPGTEDERLDVIADLYEYAHEPLNSAALDTFATMDLLDTIDFDSYTPENGAVYPNTTFGNALKQIAALIKADVGVETAMLDRNGWDHHANQGPLDGIMATMLDELTLSLEAFYLDMQSRMDRLVMVVLSEFGRRVAENASGGTDHGHGNCMMAMGGGIQGGQVLTKWPGLDPSQLNQGDLAITIDYRDIVAEILEKRVANTNVSDVFPNYTPIFQGIVEP